MTVQYSMNVQTSTQQFDDKITAAEAHLAAVDTVIDRLIHMYGPCTISPHTNYYHELVSAIIGQQLSVKAAATIENRFKDLFGGIIPTPDRILEHSTEEYRAIGMSRPKAGYIQDLAQHIVDGRLELNNLSNMTNDIVIAELTAVKGIGEWTAHMFLIFALGRLDVLPVGDLGFRSGVQRQYGLQKLPGASDCKQIAADHSWHPYESVATWYMWRSLNNVPQTP